MGKGPSRGGGWGGGGGGGGDVCVFGGFRKVRREDENTFAF